MEVPERLVVGGHWAFTLEDVNVNGWLVVRGRGEDLALGSWDGGVAVDQLSEDAPHCFNPEGQRRHVEENDVLNVTG